VRYPNDLDGLLLRARTLAFRGDRARSIPYFLRVVTLDSANVPDAVRCYACEALEELAGTYAIMDSFPAGERVARLWIRRQPRTPKPWGALASIYERMERYPEAITAIDSAVKYSVDPAERLRYTSVFYRTSNLKAIDEIWRELESSTQPAIHEDGLWAHVIAARTGGRMVEALRVAREFRRARAASVANPRLFLYEGLLEGITLMDMQRYRNAAALFDSIAVAYEAPFASRVAAHRVSYWSLAARSHALAGDTAVLAQLEGGVRTAGSKSLYATHARRHYYIRGLRLAAQQRHAEAAATFRQALVANDDNAVIIYYDLAKSLIASGRPAAAIAPLVAALSGPVSAAGLAVTRTELQELLGTAYELTGKRDSAIVAYTNALGAWQSADPQFDARRAALKARRQALAQPRLIRP